VQAGLEEESIGVDRDERAIAGRVIDACPHAARGQFKGGRQQEVGRGVRQQPDLAIGHVVARRHRFRSSVHASRGDVARWSGNALCRRLPLAAKCRGDCIHAMPRR